MLGWKEADGGVRGTYHSHVGVGIPSVLLSQFRYVHWCIECDRVLALCVNNLVLRVMSSGLTSSNVLLNLYGQ